MKILSNSSNSQCYSCKAYGVAQLDGTCSSCGSDLLLGFDGLPFVPCVEHTTYKASIYTPPIRDRRKSVR